MAIDLDKIAVNIDRLLKAEDTIAGFSEDQLQAFIYKRFWNSLPQYRRQLFAVPNGGTRHVIEANKFKATGLVAGIPDLVFFSENTLIFFELKREKGRLEDSQKLLKVIINGLKIPYFLIRTPDQFFYALFFTLMQRDLLNKEDSIKLMKAVQDEEGLIFFGLTEEQFQYEMKVFGYIFEAKIGEPENIIELTEPKTREKFITAVKKFVHLEYDYSNDFQLVFAEDYSSFVKQSIK